WRGPDPLTTPLHHLHGDGSCAVAVPVGGAVATHLGDCEADGAQAVLELADYAPLPLREPVRSLVWIRGGCTRCRCRPCPGCWTGSPPRTPTRHCCKCRPRSPAR